MTGPDGSATTVGPFPTDGPWQMTLTMPADAQPGDYSVVTRCIASPNWGSHISTSPPAILTVEPGEPRLPAEPVRGRPDFTG